MLRVLSDCLRGGLLAVGSLLLVLLLLSYMVWATAIRFGVEVTIWDGSIRLELLDDTRVVRSSFYVDTADSPSSVPIADALMPRTGLAPSGSTMLHIPLWLLSAICLAWPVTSFIIHRRRHTRGFLVVQPEVSDQKSEVSQSLVEPESNAPSDL